MNKRVLYEEFIGRIDASIAAAAYLEASWYIYAVLEDRLISMLRLSGGVPPGIRMMGSKISEVSLRAVSDLLLAANFDEAAMRDWSTKRNALMHAMAEGALTIQQVDRDAEVLATEGRSLVRTVTTQVMRLKQHRAKVAP